KVYVGARDYNFYALDTAKGFCHWNKKFEKGWAITTPSFKNSILFLGTSDDHLFMAIEPNTGNVLWKTNLQYNIFGAPAFSDSLVYTGTLMGKLFALDRNTGKIQWSFNTDGYTKNHLNYFKADDSNRDDLFGNILKKNEDFLQLYTDIGAIFSKPCIAGSYLIITSLDGTVYCLIKEQ
ncbi:MAG: outer membrane protein assembly factor BamB family protein, partial [Flavisolibacter sp.]